MITVTLTGWKPGLKKISLTHLLQSMACQGLQEAKGHVDSLLDGDMIAIEFPSLIEAERFAQAASAIGVIVTINTWDRDAT